MADEILRTVGYDLAKFPALTTKLLDPKTKVFDIAVRARRLDELVRRFVVHHPDGIVLDLGAGLDGRMFRVDPSPTVDWYDVDFPEVIALRRQVLPQPTNSHSIGADLTDPKWLDDVPTDRPAVIVADGLGVFLTEDDFVSLLNRLTNHFPSGELAFNLYTTYAVWAVKHLPGMTAIAGPPESFLYTGCSATLTHPCRRCEVPPPKASMPHLIANPVEGRGLQSSGIDTKQAGNGDYRFLSVGLPGHTCTQ